MFAHLRKWIVPSVCHMLSFPVQTPITSCHDQTDSCSAWFTRRHQFINAAIPLLSALECMFQSEGRSVNWLLFLLSLILICWVYEHTVFIVLLIIIIIFEIKRGCQPERVTCPWWWKQSGTWPRLYGIHDREEDSTRRNSRSWSQWPKTVSRICKVGWAHAYFFFILPND